MSTQAQKQDPEVEMLRVNIQDQLNRLFDQLEDLDELKDELSEEEYKEERDDTIQELLHFQSFLETAFSSNLSLSTEFTPAQEAIKKALAAMNSVGTNNSAGNNGGSSGSSAAKFRLLAETTSSLRNRLIELDRNLKLKLITKESYQARAGDIVMSLQAMGEKLTIEEETLLEAIGTRHTLLTTTTGDQSASSILASASTAVSQAQNQ